MKPKTMILMVIAVACGLGASYMTSVLLADRGPTAAELPKVAVLVAKKQVEMSTALKNGKELFEVKMMTAGDEPKNAVKDLESVKDKYIKATLRKGQFLTTDEVGDEKMVLQVPEGFRAVGVRVTNEYIAGGFAARPGSRVDLLYNVRRNTDEDTHSGILFEDVLVLAADGESTAREDKGAINAGVVTLALKPEDSLAVDLAMNQGSLRLALRGLGDKSLASKSKFSMVNMINPKNKDDKDKSKIDVVENPPTAATPQVPNVPPVAEPKQPERPKYRKHVVTVWEGDQSRRVVFLLNDQGQVVQDEVTKDGEEGAVDLPPPPRNQAPATPTVQTPRPAAPAAAPNGGKNGKGGF